MGTVIENSGTGTFGDVIQWTVNESATPFVVGDTSAGLGDGSLTVKRNDDTELVIDNDLTVVHSVLGRAKLKVNTVNLATKKTAILTTDSIMGQFISGAVKIPGVESGSPYAALDMACQLAGMRRLLTTTTRTGYWSLAGHSVGFDSDGKRIRPTGRDRVFAKPNLNYSSSGYVETVRYEEISGLVAITGVNPFYPTFVTGPTPRIRAARTYVKFTTANALTAGNIVFSFTAGPDFRTFADGVMRDATYTVTVTYTRSTGVFSVVIGYRNAAGTVTSATASSSTASSLAAGLQTIVLETYVNASNQFVVRGGVVDSTGATISTGPLVATTVAATADLTPIYASQFTISSSSSQVKDLVIRETGLADDQWASFYNSAYVNPIASFTSTLSDYRTGPAIAASTGELWDYLKQVASARAVEIVPIDGTITLREVGTRRLSLDNNVTVSRSISTASVGRNIAIINQNTSILSAPTTVQEATQNYSVGVGEVNSFDLTGLNEGVVWIYSPSVTFDSRTLPNFAWPTATTVPDPTRGTYTVTAQDHLPVMPTEWSYYGGSVTAAINPDGIGQLVLTGPTRPIPGVKGPFTLSLSDGVVDTPTLKIAGVGVTSAPTTITIPTGADPYRSNVELAGTINNVAIGDILTAYNRVAWAAARASGPVVTLTATIPVLTLAAFAVGVGSLVTWDSAVYRVDSLSVFSSGTASISASKQTTIADYQALGIVETMGDFATRWTGKTLGDFAIRPLLPLVIPAGVAPTALITFISDWYSVDILGINITTTGTPAPTVTFEYLPVGVATGTWASQSYLTYSAATNYYEFSSPTGLVGQTRKARIRVTNSAGTATSPEVTMTCVG